MFVENAYLIDKSRMVIKFCFANSFNFCYRMIFGEFCIDIVTDCMLHIMIENDLQLAAFELNKLDGYNERATE